MKILVLAALLAVVTSGQIDNQLLIENQARGPWQVGKLYHYDVDSYTLARLQEGTNSGSAFKARFTIRVPSPDRLLVKLEDPKHAMIHQEVPRDRELPKDLKYEPVEKFDQPFEITVDGGRVSALSVPVSLPLAHENLLKGLISALQLDLSTHRLVRNPLNGYDDQKHQGSFKKMETDVTGDCETLYNIYPSAPEWRFEIPNFAKHEEPMMVSKVKNYGHCHHRVAYHFGVPEGSEWAGVVHRKHEEQLVRRTTATRMLVGIQGPIYKTETSTTVQVNPQLYGKQKAEVYSNVQLKLVAYEQDNEAEWTMPTEKRNVQSLLYSVSTKPVEINDRSSQSESTESVEEFTKTIDWPGDNRPNRIRRYVDAPKLITINKVTRKAKHSDDTDNYSSSSVDSTSAFVNDDLPNSNQPAYAALYMSPQQESEKKLNPMNVQKLVQDMAQQLQNPNNMPKSDFLSKFNILVRLLASMTSEQLEITSRSIETVKSSNNFVKADMWMIYRDAMTQVGNMPAFQQIKKWIEHKKIEQEEAAEVVASLVHSIRYPTKEIMSQFFKLAVSDDVRQQKYLNTTILIAATRLINMAQVNNDTAHSYYPTHMYGRLARKHDAFVVEEVLPRLSQELDEAVKQGDSTKAQVYIKAIGNLGHRDILKIFTPYLEGKIPVSKYLRTLMVQNLGELAHQKDPHVRAVLFRILKNVAEPDELRVAAIQKIFKAHPTSAMMMSMAQMTFDDPSVQVRAILKSGILSAAELKSPRNYHLARTAQAVKWMVTKQEYGKQYASKYLSDYDDKEEDNGFMTIFTYMGSKDSILPKNMKIALKSKSQGWNKEQSITASVSDVQELYNLLEQSMAKILRQKPKSENKFKYSVEKISEMLNIQRLPKDSLEASFSVNWMGQERFFTLTESELEQLPSLFIDYTMKMATGVENHYTKVLNQAQVSIMFPLSSGMPFIYKYKEPLVIHAHTKTVAKNLQENQGKNINIDKEIHITYARNMDGSVGFMDTLVNQHAKVGVVSKIQWQLPLKLHLENKPNNFEIAMEPLRPDQDYTLLHFSVWPYSSIQKKDTLVTESLDPSTKVIKRRQKVVSTDFRYGQTFGHLYQIQGYSYSSDYNNYGSLFKSENLLTNLGNILYQRDTALTHFNVKRYGKQSQNQRTVFTFAYDTYYNQKQETPNDQSLIASNMEDVNPNSQVRRDEIAKRVSSGINNARIRILDLSATFEGKQKQQFVATAAMAVNPVNPKIQYAIFLNKNSVQYGNEQINAAATVLRPPVTPLNFVEAITKELKMEFNVDVIYGKSGKGNINIQGHAERTKKRTEELKEQPLAKICVEQIETNNLYQDACHKMVIQAHAPDYIKAVVNYKDISPVVRNMTYKVFKVVEHIGFWFTDANILKVTPDGKIEMETRFDYPENNMDLSLRTRLGEYHFNRVPIPRVTAEAMAIYTPLNSHKRIINSYTRTQFQPFCTVDSSQVRTFSNRSYDYTLPNSWHVILHDDGSRQGSRDGLVVLARRSEDKQLQLYISYKSKNGDDLELEVKPNPQGPKSKATVSVKTNAQLVLEGDSTVYMVEVTHEPLLEYYWQTEEVLIFNIQENRLHVMYDGQRLVVIADENRNNINGLCGRMTGDARDDYMVANKLVQKPEFYGAYFALKESDSDRKTMEMREQAKQSLYPNKHESTVIFPADEEWRQANEVKFVEKDSRYRSVYKSRSLLQKQKECQLNEQVQYFEDHGKICITTSPLPACQSHCRGESYNIRNVLVVCGPKFESRFREYRDQIRRGENPQPSGTPEQHPKQYRVPTSCLA